MDQSPLFLRKYQPLMFADFENADTILNMLKLLIAMNNLNILFIGNIGTGKTTFLNATINEYYNGIKTEQYKDNILYINSLKEQGINFYRNDVKTFCQSCSTIKGKKKMIVLDDIDIINEQSQQVFRNYVDKYSKNVQFIATCVNPQKIIESLQSRLILIKIIPLQPSDLYQISAKILQAENISITPDALDFIINVSNNNPKILINYMEKFKLLDQHINRSIVTNVCTNISFFVFEEYTQMLINKDLKHAVKVLYNIYDKGYSVMDILDSYFLYVKTSDILNETQKYNIIPIICKYITIFHNIHEDEIELAAFTNHLYKIL